MANERKDSITITVDKGGGLVSLSNTLNSDLAGNGKWSNPQVIGTSYEPIAFPGDLVTEGVTVVACKNLGPTNYVELAKDASGTYVFAKLKAGEAALVPVNCATSTDPTWYARANTAAITLQLVAAGT